jgi:hypothetical protein
VKIMNCLVCGVFERFLLSSVCSARKLRERKKMKECDFYFYFFRKFVTI